MADPHRSWLHWRAGLLLAVLIGVVCFVAACGDTTIVNQIAAPAPEAGIAATADANAPEEDGDAAADCDAGALACAVVTCPGSAKTTLHGKVYDPGGSVGLSNVTVYIPDGTDPITLPPIADSTVDPGGVQCGACVTPVNAMRTAQTDASGEFVLEDVPVGLGIPLVIQLGKWRRLLSVDVPLSCTANVALDKSIRLPRTSTEGNMPQIAVTTSKFDAMECVLRAIGIDDAEFVEGHDPTGHVHLFKAFGGGQGPDAEPFWTDSTQLRKYDAVFFNCEGEEHLENKGGGDAGTTTSGALVDYLNAGGRALVAHMEVAWYKNSPSLDFQNIGTWGSLSTFQTMLPVNTAFPEGAALASWLTANGMAPPIALGAAANEARAVYPPAVAWFEEKPGAGPVIFTFDTPITATSGTCGRAAFADMHFTDSQTSPTKMADCTLQPGGLNPTQRVFEYFLFSVLGCQPQP